MSHRGWCPHGRRSVAWTNRARAKVLRMGIDITLEDLIRLSDVPKLKCMPPGKDGKRISLATIYRWALGGTGGIKLETLKVPSAVKRPKVGPSFATVAETATTAS
jgi:hypothetical protein